MTANVSAAHLIQIVIDYYDPLPLRPEAGSLYDHAFKIMIEGDFGLCLQFQSFGIIDSVAFL